MTRTVKIRIKIQEKYSFGNGKVVLYIIIQKKIDTLMKKKNVRNGRRN